MTDYQSDESTIRRRIEEAVILLEKNSDIALILSRQHVVDVITRSVLQSALCGLSPEELNGVINVLNEACNGASPIEEWECHTLTGLTKQQLREVLEKLNE